MKTSAKKYTKQNKKIRHKLTLATSAGSVAYAGGKEAAPVASVRLEPAQGKEGDDVFFINQLIFSKICTQGS